MLHSLLALALFTLPLAAQADTSYACESNGMGVQVEVTEVSAATYMQIDGKVIHALRTCMGWFHGNPRMGGKWRCPHGEVGSSERFEVYPILSPPNGDEPYVRVIRWNGDKSSSIDLKDCE